MTLQINGQSQELALDQPTLSALLEQLGLAEQPLLIEHNGEALHPSAQASLLLQDGDRLELLRMVAGG